MNPANCSEVDFTLALLEDLEGVVRCLQLAIFNATAAAQGRRPDGLFSLAGHDVLLLLKDKKMRKTERCWGVIERGVYFQNDDEGHDICTQYLNMAVEIQRALSARTPGSHDTNDPYLVKTQSKPPQYGDSGVMKDNVANPSRCHAVLYQIYRCIAICEDIKDPWIQVPWGQSGTLVLPPESCWSNALTAVGG